MRNSIMNRIVYLFGLVFFLKVGLVYPQKNQKKELTVSIIVPCYHGHARYLRELLFLYQKQTILPDEVVISLSGIEKVSADIIADLEVETWPFKVKLIYSKGQHYAGQNRNLACAHADGDIFITQDADDVAHPQRTEIIKYFFENYDIDFLMHQFLLENQIGFDEFMKKRYKLESIPFINPKSFSQAWDIGYVTNGNVAMRSHVLSKCKWSSDQKGQDVKFNQLVFQHFKRRFVVKVPIYFYRINLTSDGGTKKQLFAVRRSQKTMEEFPVTVIYYD